MELKELKELTIQYNADIETALLNDSNKDLYVVASGHEYVIVKGPKNSNVHKVISAALVHPKTFSRCAAEDLALHIKVRDGKGNVHFFSALPYFDYLKSIKKMAMDVIKALSKSL